MTSGHYLELQAGASTSAPAAAANLIVIARGVPEAPATISEFVADVLAETSVYSIPSMSKGLARYCARSIADVAAMRRKTVPELLYFEDVADDLTRLRSVHRVPR